MDVNRRRASAREQMHLKAVTFLAFMLLAASLLCPAPILAQDMGVFSVERRARLSFSESGLGLTYSVSISSAPASEEIQQADANGDGQIDEIERKIYFIGLARRVREGLRLSIGREQVDLKLQSMQGDFPTNDKGAKIVTSDFLFIVSLPAQWKGGDITLDDAVFSDRIGARELIVDPPPGWKLETLDGVPKDNHFYFEGPKGAGPWSARFELRQPGAVVEKPPEKPQAPAEQKDYLESALRGKEFTALVLWALIIAFAVGAGHALMPGHGTALVNAYLVGKQKTLRHAALLGWVVTAIRTTPVFALGVITLLFDRYLLSEEWLRWQRILSAIAVIVLGVWVMVWYRLATKMKEPPVPTGVSTSEVIALGITGGFFPSPSALAFLFAPLCIGQPALGLGLVVAFGFGIEAMMTLLGLLRISAPSLADGMETLSEKIRLSQLIWGVVILAMGAILLVRLW